MQNQKGNKSVNYSFIIVVVAVAIFTYIIINKNKQTDQNLPEGSASGQVEVNVNDSASTNVEQSVNSQKQMNPNTKILSNFTPVSNTPTLQKIDLVVGSGAEVKPGATVSVHYTGAVAATGVIFQSSKDFGPTPVTFPLSGVIKGWTDGIPGMKVGGTRRLVIPAAEAYGATPPPGSGIPANADLVFDVELISIQ